MDIRKQVMSSPFPSRKLVSPEAKYAVTRLFAMQQLLKISPGLGCLSPCTRSSQPGTRSLRMPEKKMVNIVIKKREKASK